MYQLRFFLYNVVEVTRKDSWSKNKLKSIWNEDREPRQKETGVQVRKHTVNLNVQVQKYKTRRTFTTSRELETVEQKKEEHI